MDKLTLAHDWVMKFGEPTYINGSVEQAWNYADTMFAEAEKRQDKTLPDAFWQPDWSLAPDDAMACAMDHDGRMFWHKKNPTKNGEWEGYAISEYVDHGYTGDWRNSLRIRPSSK